MYIHAQGECLTTRSQPYWGKTTTTECLTIFCHSHCSDGTRFNAKINTIMLSYALHTYLHIPIFVIGVSKRQLAR